jgi:multimeric flavodoxin WrbA
MNILAINGSGRSLGNNYNLLNTCLESFNKNNNTTEIVQLSDLQIQGCKSCYSCKGNNNQCIIEDDMNLISKKILDSDLLIISIPIYMWQISAQTKLFMERLYPLYHFDIPSDLKGKKLILFFTQATPDKTMFEAYFEHVKASMTFLGFDVIDVVVMSGVRNIDDYKNHPDILSQITNFGNKNSTQLK